LRSLALFCDRPCPGFVPVDFPSPSRGRGTRSYGRLSPEL